MQKYGIKKKKWGLCSESAICPKMCFFGSNGLLSGKVLVILEERASSSGKKVCHWEVDLPVCEEGKSMGMHLLVL